MEWAWVRWNRQPMKCREWRTPRSRRIWASTPSWGRKAWSTGTGTENIASPASTPEPLCTASSATEAFCSIDRTDLSISCPFSRSQQSGKSSTHSEESESQSAVFLSAEWTSYFAHLTFVRTIHNRYKSVDIWLSGRWSRWRSGRPFSETNWAFSLVSWLWVVIFPAESPLVSFWTGK